MNLRIKIISAVVGAFALMIGTLIVLPAQAAGPLTNRLDVPFTANGITSDYHIFAAGLDWSKQVGLLVYTDGSGGYGLDNPNSNYLLDADGTDGLVAVAKKHNLLLVTPEAPAPSCDGEDNCWYNTSTTPNAAAKAGWANALVSYVKSEYTIASNRVVIGGYSSGAQWTTRYFLPRHGEAQSVDLAVAIAYGGAPDPTSSASFTAAYKAATVVSFDTGTADSAYSSQSWGAIGGYNWYTNAGFKTDYLWPSGVGHGRSGQFDSIMDREITQHLAPAGTGGPTPTTEVPNWQTTVQPTRNGAKFTINVPTSYTGRTYVRLSSGNYLYEVGGGVKIMEFVSQSCNTSLTYRVEAPSGTLKQSGSFTTLAC